MKPLAPALARLIAVSSLLFALSAPHALAEEPPPVAAAPPEAAKTPSPENKWRIECSEGANSDGEIVFRVTPKDGQPIDVSVPIKNGTSENAVARRIRDAFRAALPKQSYSVETDDGEDVLVKKHYGADDFSLQLVSNGVKGVRLDVERE
jgi:invasion protein IalB